MNQKNALQSDAEKRDNQQKGSSPMSLSTRVLKSIFEVVGYPQKDSFQEEIDQLWKYRVRGVQKNSGDRARILIKKLYSIAAEEKIKVRQVTGHFDPFVYDNDEVVEALDRCIESGVDIEVVVSDEAFLKNDIEFCNKISAHAKVHKAFGEKLPHILVLGDEGSVYRAEPNPHDLTRSADFSFNCPEYGGILVEKFDKFVKQYLGESTQEGTINRIESDPTGPADATIHSPMAPPAPAV